MSMPKAVHCGHMNPSSSGGWIMITKSCQEPILVRKLLKRGSFRSVADLQRQILAFIEYYNATMAKPFAWTYQGKALTA